MTHHQFGAIAGDLETGTGVFAVGDVVLVTEHSTLAVESLTADEVLPVIVLELTGRINKSQDTVQAAWLFSLIDAGQAAAALLNAARRVGTDEAMRDFMAGFTRALQ